MKTSLKRIFALILALASILTFTACGKDDPSDPASSGVKDEVVIATPSEPTVFFVQDGQYTSAMAKDSPVLYNIYEYLCWMDENGAIQPWVATEWAPSDDGLTWTFKLRDDVTFHNGDKLTAEDVAFTYNTALEKNPTLSKNLLINLVGAEAVDATTVKFTLSAPFEGFPAETTSRIGALISKAYYEQVGPEGYNEKPIGSGAYMFESRTSGQEIVLKAYDGYREGKAAIGTVRLRTIANTSTSFISLKSGTIDVVNLADVSSCQQLTDKDPATYITQASNSRAMMVLNCRPDRDRITMDENLRKAIQYAINKNDIITGALSGAGSAIDMCAPYFFSGAPDKGSFFTVDPAGDVEKAKEYLAQSNYNGQALDLLVNAGTPEAKAAQIIQGQLLAVGINAEIRAVDSATTSAGYNNGDFDLYLLTTTGSLGDVSTLATFYYPQREVKAYPDWEVLADLCVRSDTASGQERKDLMAELGDIVNTKAYDVCIYCKDSCIAFSENLQGLTLNTNGVWRVNDWSWK